MAKRPDTTAETAAAWRAIDELFHKVLDRFYNEKRRVRPFPTALHLLRLLDKYDPRAETLLGMSGRWLVAEVDGDLSEAIRYREMELTALRRHIADGLIGSGGLDADEFSDRLDLLASAYLDAERYDDALRLLDESESFCTAHGVPFDGEEIRTDAKRAMDRRKTARV